MAWIIWIKIFSLKCFQVSFQSQNECKLRYVTYNWRIWALNIYAMCGLSCGIAYGDTSHRWRCCCPFSCPLLLPGGKWRDKKCTGWAERDMAEDSSGDRGCPHSSSQHALSPFGFQKPMRNPLIWHLDSHQKGFSPSINCSQESECHKL